jgi:hypothetical protein
VSALLLVHDAIVSGLSASPLLTGVQVTYHGGDFTADDLLKYSKRAPALIVALLDFDIELEAGTVVAIAQWGMVAITKNAPAVPVAGMPAHATAAITTLLHRGKRTRSAIALVDAATRALMRVFYGFSAPASMTVSAPSGFRAINEYHPKLDAQDIALWGVSWQQRIDLVDAPEITDLLTDVHVDYDLYPRPAGEDLNEAPEAEDLIEDLDV